MKNLLKLGKALSKPEQKEIHGGANPPLPPGLCTPGDPCEKPWLICCATRGGAHICVTPSQCAAF